MSKNIDIEKLKMDQVRQFIAKDESGLTRRLAVIGCLASLARTAFDAAKVARMMGHYWSEPPPDECLQYLEIVEGNIDQQFRQQLGVSLVELLGGTADCQDGSEGRPPRG